MAPVPLIPLNNGVQIPQLGFGVFQIKPEDTVKATTSALEIGYRHIDTAQMYGNEREVGLAVRESGIPREDVFVTSKLNNNRLERDDILRSFDASLDALGFDYLDLFLIHWPLPAVADYVARWKVMEEIHASGRATAIGVSNFHPNHLRNVLAASEITPAVNRSRIEENFAIFDFELEDADMTAISALDRGERTGPNPDEFNYVPG